MRQCIGSSVQDWSAFAKAALKDGKQVSELKLDSPRVFDSMAAAGGKLIRATVDGKVVCPGSK
jgi:hypothetical protein